MKGCIAKEISIPATVETVHTEVRPGMFLKYDSKNGEPVRYYFVSDQHRFIRLEDDGHYTDTYASSLDYHFGDRWSICTLREVDNER